MNGNRQPGWLALVLAVGLSACAPTHLTVNVKSPPGTNQGRPLHMVVRAVDAQRYMTEFYADVAERVVHPDDSVVQTLVIYPGEKTQTRVKIPEEMPLAISFLFTTPDGAWQVLLDTPIPGRVDIELEESRIRTDAPTKKKKKSGKGDEAKAEPPKLEAPKLEAPKVEPPKVEAAPPGGK
ncbi:hypothetical protein LZ198_23345 [Myxococcus sp. K15C18031901]|uniref:hypothetical protein n=1 Tax=Myxococcus dinghuensis TaxID=2906761 RepID=UPI0020A7363C|nr:hypothetical protein [Myxococcus dinghuensis]MCP3101816.1 hypothetical protein [Myxococcus dinghuensis]